MFICFARRHLLKKEQIEADNEKRMQWNHEADRAIVGNVLEAEIGEKYL